LPRRVAEIDGEVPNAITSPKAISKQLRITETFSIPLTMSPPLGAQCRPPGNAVAI
jgi:hypothetical protein